MYIFNFLKLFNTYFLKLFLILIKYKSYIYDITNLTIQP